MELEHREFLKEHYNNYETALSGYVRNLDLPVLKMYEHIYRLYLNPTFILTIWCGDCRMQMILKLYAYYIALPISEKSEKSEVIENQQVEGNIFYPEEIKITLNQQQKKRGRKSKSNG